jgi:hypothetical protein
MVNNRLIGNNKKNQVEDQNQVEGGGQVVENQEVNVQEVNVQDQEVRNLLAQILSEKDLEDLEKLMRQYPLPINPCEVDSNQRARKEPKRFNTFNVYCKAFYLNLEYLKISNLKHPILKHLVSKLFSEESKETKEYYKFICNHIIKFKENKLIPRRLIIESKENDKLIFKVHRKKVGSKKIKGSFFNVYFYLVSSFILFFVFFFFFERDLGLVVGGRELVLGLGLGLGLRLVLGYLWRR